MNRSLLGKSLLIVGLVLGLGAAAARPASADGWDHGYRDHGWRDHDWQEREWREHNWREMEWREHDWRARHAAPTVVYASPYPGYYYAPPPVAPNPYGLNIVVPFNIR